MSAALAPSVSFEVPEQFVLDGYLSAEQLLALARLACPAGSRVPLLADTIGDMAGTVGQSPRFLARMFAAATRAGYVARLTAREYRDFRERWFCTAENYDPPPLAGPSCRYTVFLWRYANVTGELIAEAMFGRQRGVGKRVFPVLLEPADAAEPVPACAFEPAPTDTFAAEPVPACAFEPAPTDTFAAEPVPACAFEPAPTDTFAAEPVPACAFEPAPACAFLAGAGASVLIMNEGNDENHDDLPQTPSDHQTALAPEGPDAEPDPTPEQIAEWEQLAARRDAWRDGGEAWAASAAARFRLATWRRTLERRANPQPPAATLPVPPSDPPRASVAERPRAAAPDTPPPDPAPNPRAALRIALGLIQALGGEQPDEALQGAWQFLTTELGCLPRYRDQWRDWLRFFGRSEAGRMALEEIIRATFGKAVKGRAAFLTRCLANERVNSLWDGAQKPTPGPTRQSHPGVGHQESCADWEPRDCTQEVYP